MVTIDTKDILFIVGGAFTELEKQLKSKHSSGIGFGQTLNKETNAEKYFVDIQPEDLIKYGLIPEFIGRFSALTFVNSLNELQLVQVLTQPKNALIKQYQYMFELDGIKLTITQGAKLQIAKRARELKTNARGLKNILDKILLPYQFDATEMKNRGVVEIKITEQVVSNSADPELKFKDEKLQKQTRK